MKNVFIAYPSTRLPAHVRVAKCDVSCVNTGYLKTRWSWLDSERIKAMLIASYVMLGDDTDFNMFSGMWCQIVRKYLPGAVTVGTYCGYTIVIFTPICGNGDLKITTGRIAKIEVVFYGILKT